MLSSVTSSNGRLAVLLNLQSPLFPDPAVTIREIDTRREDPRPNRSGRRESRVHPRRTFRTKGPSRTARRGRLERSGPRPRNRHTTVVRGHVPGTCGSRRSSIVPVARAAGPRWHRGRDRHGPGRIRPGSHTRRDPGRAALPRRNVVLPGRCAGRRDAGSTCRSRRKPAGCTGHRPDPRSRNRPQTPE